MKFTPYGFIVTIAITIFLSMYNIFNYKTLINFFISIFLQKFMCKDCDSVYTMASYMALLPLFHVILNDCNRIKNFSQAFSIVAALGRIGCYFAGCCTGKQTDKKSGIKYKGAYSINKKLGKHIVYVKPTIIYEIIIQIIFAFIMLYFKNGYLYFGPLNAILIIITNLWRLEKRMGNDQSSNAIPPISLFLTFLITMYKCKDLNVENNFDINKINLENFNFNYLIIGLILGLIVSNDINVKDII